MKRLLWWLLAVVALVSLWFLFRPERLVIDKKVDEPLSFELRAAPQRAG
ncbi:hypothetical protein [Archangium violaceum]